MAEENKKENTNKEKQEGIDPQREQREAQRTKLDAAHGKDPIEIERNKSERMEDVSKFAGFDGDLGDEGQDFSDLSSEQKKNHNYYDPAAATGGSPLSTDPKKTERMHITESGKAGLGAGEEDSYVDPQGRKKVHPEKQESSEQNRKKE
jgi:hypothetical protein